MFVSKATVKGNKSSLNILLQMLGRKKLKQKNLTSQLENSRIWNSLNSYVLSWKTQDKYKNIYISLLSRLCCLYIAEQKITSYRNALPEMSQQRRQEQSKAIVGSIVQRQNYKRSETDKPRPWTIHSSSRISHTRPRSPRGYRKRNSIPKKKIQKRIMLLKTKSIDFFCCFW